MPEPFEPSDQPRLLTPEELAIIVRMCRSMRSWSQENLATEAGITVRTVQRVEAAKSSDVQTRRALARAFGAEDIDHFNKPDTFLSMEQLTEKLRQEEENRKRNFLELPTKTADGNSMMELATQAGAFSFCKAAGYEPPKVAQELLAELQDHMQDSIDIASDVSATDRLNWTKGLDLLIKKLGSLGISLRIAERNTSIVFQNGNKMPLTVGYAFSCQKGKEPATVWVPKKLSSMI